MTRRRRWMVAGILLSVLLVVGGTFAVSAARYATAPVRVTVNAQPITSFDNRDPSKVRFGALEFRGGLAMTSKFEPFGGISGIHMEPDGSRFTGVTDRGSWIRGRIVYRDGKPEDVVDVEMAPILGADGKPLAERGWYDSESLTELDGKFYVGLERVDQIVRFDFRRDGVLARGEPIKVPDDFKTFARNKGLECLAAAPKGSVHAGRLIAVTENSLDAAGNLRAYVIGDAASSTAGASVIRFSVKQSDEFEVSDCTVLLPGDLLLLERRYSPARGVAMRIRRVPVAAIKEGALVDGKIMIEADLAYQIDNMEGIGLHRTAQGETVLTLVSDDNFSAIQRNLLLQFTLAGE